MKVETANHYFVRCDQPGCMGGYLGWNELCQRCEGTGWITIPDVIRSGGMLKSVIAYCGFVTVAAVVMYFLFR